MLLFFARVELGMEGVSPFDFCAKDVAIKEMVGLKPPDTKLGSAPLAITVDELYWAACTRFAEYLNMFLGADTFAAFTRLQKTVFNLRDDVTIEYSLEEKQRIINQMLARYSANLSELVALVYRVAASMAMHGEYLSADQLLRVITAIRADASLKAKFDSYYPVESALDPTSDTCKVSFDEIVDILGQITMSGL